MAVAGSINQKSYLKFRHGFQPGMRFQHNKAPAHKARSMMDYIKPTKIEVLDWPPYSPDPNPNR